MQRQYGSRLFKCNRFGCPYFRTGFEARSERDRHLRVHDRPYKCDRPNCDFSDVGFGSQARLNVHLHYHEKQAKKPVTHLADIDKDEDVELIILDAVKADDIDLVRDFIADVPDSSQKLLDRAVLSSSYEMLNVLLDACNSEQIDERTILDGAVRADNLEAARLLLSRGASLERERVSFLTINHAVSNLSPEMIKLLFSYGQIREMIAINVRRIFEDWSLSPPLEGSKEASFIQCLSLLPDCTKKEDAFQRCFRANAERGCSIAIAEFLLRNDVDINSRPNGSNTALFSASKRKDQRAAELMKFLLESGADPLAPTFSRSQPIADRPGPRNISKWLGVSWEQLVEESRKKHAASLRMGPQ